MNKKIYIGKTFVASILEPVNVADNKVLVVCYPGSGEAFGLGDGSKLGLINYGFDESKEWPFTIMKVQTLSTNYSTAAAEVMKYVDDNCDKCIVMGWSLGGREVMDLLLGFKGRTLSSKVKLMVTIDGPASGAPDFNVASVPLVIVTGKGGLYYYPLANERNALISYNKEVSFNEMAPTLDHRGLMLSVYRDVNSPAYKLVMSKILSLIGEPTTPNKIIGSSVVNGVITFVDELGNKYTINATPQ